MPIDLSSLSEEQLLRLRICDLPLRIPGTWLAECVDQLYAELAQKGIGFRPPCYLADEWLTPDQEPIVGIPFYLAHPALMKLEKKMMLEVEGGTRTWCMKLLRHETGHAINYAYRLYRRKTWKKMFGPFAAEYGDTYRFRPYSKSFVIHLEDYYAQYHPDEDFAETFAVWLTPGSLWSVRYAGWKALDKLEYVDRVLGEIKRENPPVAKGKPYWQASALRITLENYYRKKRHFYAEDFPDFHDANLKRIFPPAREGNREGAAAEIIRKYRKSILDNVSFWTGERKYVIDGLLATIVARCNELNLSAWEAESLVVSRLSVYVTTLMMNYMHTGRLRGNGRTRPAKSRHAASSAFDCFAISEAAGPRPETKHQ